MTQINIPKQVSSDFAILDVKMGRHKLAKLIEDGHAAEVVIRGKIKDCFSVGNDDGTSIEFGLQVDELEVVIAENEGLSHAQYLARQK